MAAGCFDVHTYIMYAIYSAPHSSALQPGYCDSFRKALPDTESSPFSIDREIIVQKWSTEMALLSFQYKIRRKPPEPSYNIVPIKR